MPNSNNRPNTGKLAFLLYVIIVVSMGLFLSASGILRRAELQTIDKLFEARPWFLWSEEGLRRLNPQKLQQYHNEHEIPNQWWAWDYTLSWLIEQNQIRPRQNIVIFNHLPEDEPPLEAIEQKPYLKPLMRYPVSRATLADMVEFLAQSKAKAIILDNDLPQYSYNDDRLAEVIHSCSTGKFSGNKVPVLIAGTAVHRTASSATQLNYAPPAPGVFRELQKLEPQTDLLRSYVGNVNMIMDEDQIVRRCALSSPGSNPMDVPSIAIKSLTCVGIKVPANVPDAMDIDFVGPPNAETYPVRPLTYLLDPDLRSRITAGTTAGDNDVRLKDAIVIIGDGVTDLFATPYTNSGVNLRSGSEIIANAIDTIARQSWPRRLTEWEQFAWLLVTTAAGAAIRSCRRLLPGSSKGASSDVFKVMFDFTFFLATIACSAISACFAFAHFGLIAPVLVPVVALSVGALATSLWEREAESTYWLKEQLKQSELNRQLERDKHTTELRASQAEARARQVQRLERIRKDFVRKINHDLKAPVTVMSWTLAKWKQEGLACKTAGDKIERLMRTSDRLVNLLHELANNYETAEEETGEVSNVDLLKLLQDCVTVAQTLAESRKSQIVLDLPSRRARVTANALEVSRVFDNLIRNALLHNPPGTLVQVQIRSQAHRHQVTVSDNGVGFACNDPTEIFKSRTDDDGLEHLGLSIAKGFVEKNGGTISASSTKSRGSTFVVAFPSADLSVAEAQETSSASAATAQQQEDNKTKKELLSQHKYHTGTVQLPAAASAFKERHLVEGNMAAYECL